MTYNGWSNRLTWNVSLWIQNDEHLYSIARNCSCYEEFKQAMREMETIETPDGVAYNDPEIDSYELNEKIWGAINDSLT